MNQTFFRADLDHRDPGRTASGEATMLERQSIPIGRVSAGDVLASPVLSTSGSLLVPNGTTVTESILERLHDWKIDQVTIYRSVPVPKPRHVPAPTKQTRQALLNRDVSKRLSIHIDDSLTFVSNRGDALIADVTRITDAEYDPKHQLDVSQAHEALGLMIPHWVDRLCAGATIDATPLLRFAMQYRQFLLTDSDATLMTPVANSHSLAAASIRLSLLGMAIGIQMGFDANNVARIGCAGLVHDWGWSFLHDGLRTARRPLEPLEQIERTKHPTLTARMLERMSPLPPLTRRAAEQVHEQLDGGGYPHGDSGSHVHLFARILSVAHHFLERTAGYHRTEAMSPYEAMESLLQDAAKTILDPHVVRGLLRVQSLFPIGSLVQLPGGGLARVLRANGDHYSAPVVQLIANSRVLDLSRMENVTLRPVSKADLQRMLERSRSASVAKAAASV